MPKMFVSSERWKEFCAEKNIIYDSPTIEQFLNFFTELFNQAVSHSVLISAKIAVAHVLRMKYQHIPQYPSVIKYFKGSFNLRSPLPKLSFVWDVQIILMMIMVIITSTTFLSHKLVIISCPFLISPDPCHQVLDTKH